MAFLSGLRGNDDIFSALFGAPGVSQAEPAKSPSAAPGRRRGFLGGLRRAFDPSNVAAMQATLSGDYGTAGQIAAQRAQLRARQQAAEAEAEQEAQLRAQAAQALAARGYTKADIGGMRPEEVSQLLLSLNQPRQFGAEGGTLHTPGQPDYRAPSRTQVGRSIIDFGANSSTPNPIYQGVEPIPVQQGGAVYGYRGDGSFVSGTDQGPPPAAPSGAANEQQLRQWAADAIRRGADPAQVSQRLEQMLRGGAGSGAQRPFSGPGRNNPGALRVPGSTRFQSFPTEAAGIRAQEAQIGRYLQRGITTPRAIVETYAPRMSRGGDNTDAQVNNYIAHVARRTGRPPNAPITAADIPLIAQAMREFETGRR